MARFGSPSPSVSILMTSAPWSAMNCVMSGPGRNSDRSTTRRPWSFTALCLLPVRRALLDEGVHPLAALRVREVRRDDLPGERVGLRQVHVHLLVKGALPGDDRRGRLCRNGPGEGKRFGVQGIRSDDFVD